MKIKKYIPFTTFPLFWGTILYVFGIIFYKTIGNNIFLFVFGMGLLLECIRLVRLLYIRYSSRRNTVTMTNFYELLPTCINFIIFINFIKFRINMYMYI